MSNEREKDPGIRVVLDKRTRERISCGPLASTGGRGAATWVRSLIISALDNYESVGTGSTQIDLDALRAMRGQA